MSEIEILKAKIAELESKLNKQKKQHEPVSCSICHKTFKNEYKSINPSSKTAAKHINHMHADELKNKEQQEQQKQEMKLCHIEEEEEQTNEEQQFEEEENDE